MIIDYDKIMTFGSTALRIAAFYSLIEILRKRYGRDLAKEVRILEKLDFKHKRPF